MPVGGNFATLSVLNDDGADFNQIAKVLLDNPEQYFRPIGK